MYGNAIVITNKMKSTRGMTLVELLIVFTIMGLLVSLVAPSSTKLLDKARAQEEWLVLDRTIDSLAFRAFADGKYVELAAEDQTLQWKIDGKPAGALALGYLRFEKDQIVVISPNGFADLDEIVVFQGDRPRALRLNRWLGIRG